MMPITYDPCRSGDPSSYKQGCTVSTSDRGKALAFIDLRELSN